MSQGIIYLITNKVTGDRFIGQTTLPMNKTWAKHIEDSKRMSSTPLHKAFRKYGIDKFNIKLVDECDTSLLNEKEQYWIQYYDTINQGYNTGVRIEPPVIEKKEEPIIPKERKLRTEPWGFLLENKRGNGSHFAITIEGTNIETGEVRTWRTINEAAIELTGDIKKGGNISRASKRNNVCYGYRWKPLVEKERNKKVFGLNKKTGALGSRYNSIRKAANTLGNGNTAGILKSLRNPGKYSWKGYYWYYATFTPETTT